jgi:glycosyltransferase involved in cell wall biosynthesis
MRRRVLLIAYLFPPLGGSGALRPLKLAKYLPAAGWDPVVLTVGNPDWYYARDAELLQELPPEVEVLRAPMLRAAWVYRLLNPCGWGPGDAVIRTYLLHPDEQIGWLPGAVRRARQRLRLGDIEAIYSSSGPLTCHLVAKRVARAAGLPWVAEFRDEWLEAPNLPLPTRWHRAFHLRLERGVATAADQIVTMAPYFGRLLAKHGIPSDKLHTITAGFDPADVPNGRHAGKHPERFTVVFSGVVYETFPPDRLLRAVSELIDERAIEAQRLRLLFVGPWTIDPTLDPHGVARSTGFVPRRQALGYMGQADLLLLLLSRERGVGVIPSKVFEYMATGTPILALVPPEAEVATLLRRTGTGYVADFADPGAIKHAFAECYARWRQGTLEVGPDWTEVRHFDQRHIAARVAAVLERAAARP